MSIISLHLLHPLPHPPTQRMTSKNLVEVQPVLFFHLWVASQVVSCVQTGQYSTQIFCLAVLLSSLFVYNQMGGIDEAALDRLSLVTEMTKHIRVRANTTAGDSDVASSCNTQDLPLLLIVEYFKRKESTVF